MPIPRPPIAFVSTNGTKTNSVLPGLPDTNTAPRKFATGIPGFDELSQIASGNIRNLLAGTESPDITRNINATWGAGSGLAPGSEFLKNRAVDLYGRRSEARKSQGMKDLLSTLGTYSGTVVATPGQIMGDEASRRAEALQAQRMAEEQRQFNEQLAFQREREASMLDLENRRFRLQEDLAGKGSRPRMQYWRQLYGPGVGGGALGQQKTDYSFLT